MEFAPDTPSERLLSASFCCLLLPSHLCKRLLLSVFMVLSSTRVVTGSSSHFLRYIKDQAMGRGLWPTQGEVKEPGDIT